LESDILPNRILSLCGAVVALTFAPFASTSRAFAQASETQLPNAPSFVLQTDTADTTGAAAVPAAADPLAEISSSLDFSNFPQEMTDKPQHAQCPVDPKVEVDKNCVPIPLERQEPKRILGFMPNFRSVSAGAVVHPPGWKYNFKITTHQAFDYSSFLFLGLTTISAEGINSHPVLGKGMDGFYAYLWRGFLDKTDGAYMQGFFMPSLLHEDTRYYPMGHGHPIVVRALYVMSRQVVTRTYGGHQTPNFAGLGGKVLTQLISRTYYPTGATSFGVLATKFAYAAMRDIAFTSVREFYPDVAAHYIRKHREKVLQQAERDAKTTSTPPAVTKPL
jgi:hypothetical protein